MDDLPEQGSQTSDQGFSASSAGPTKHFVHDQEVRDSGTTSFLTFVHLVEQYCVPIVDAQIADAQQRSDEAVGILGKGGQFVVDRTYSNQRYPGRRGLAAETNTVYKRNIWSTQSEESDTIHQHDRLQTFVNELKVLGHLRSSQNIIDLIGVAWEQDSHAQISPVLALEYAQHNSLTRYLTENFHTIRFHEKKRLIQDVTCGVAQIHEADFVWGDCKPDNVLICQHPYDRTSITAKISDFGLSVTGTSDQARFLGFSMPWTSREARDALGMTALKHSEIYSVGLVIWSILLSGKQFQKAHWHFNGPIETDQDGIVSSRQIFALTVTGELQAIACQSIEAFLLSVLSEIEVRIFSTVLRESLSLVPHLRPSARDLHQALQQETTESPQSVTCHQHGHEEFSMDWLMSNFGPNTRLHAVGVNIFKHLSTVASGTTSASIEFQLGIFHATGLGCERDLHLAVQHMHTSAILGHKQAQDLHKKLKKIARTVQNDRDTARHSLSATLIDLWDDCESEKDDSASGFRELAGKSQVSDAGRGSLHSKGKRKWDADTSIEAALALGDLGCVMTCMHSPGFNLNYKNKQQESLLLCAVLWGWHDVTQSLLHAGADPSATDERNRNILHALSTLTGPSLHRMISVIKDFDVVNKKRLVNLTSVVALTAESGATGGGKPGTPLEWAVDARNTAAARYLLYLGSDPSVSHSGWPALHRAASRHDCWIIDTLLEGVTTEALMRYDRSGRSPLACAVADVNALDRILINEGNENLSEQLIDLVRAKGHDLSRLNIATESGESVVYHSLRSNKLRSHTISAFWHWDWNRLDMNAVPGPTGPNQWSAFRRAMYCSNADPFRLICSGLAKANFQEALERISPDGLTIFHELAFLPVELAMTMFDVILKRAKHYKVKLKLRRMEPRNSRPRLTPFQIAVICGNTVLAQTYVDEGLARPLRGLEGRRFLAFVIEYPTQDPYRLSTWLSLIITDPIVEATRRYPHPTSMSRPLQYLLQHEKAWWRRAKKKTSYWRQGVLGESPLFDKDVEHDPFISWTPNLLTSLEFNQEGEQPAAVIRYGADHVLDNNVFGLGHRLRHTLDYGSFLLTTNPDAQAHSRDGHPYLTALELGLSVVLRSDYTQHAKRNFNTLLQHFRGPTYCNFPYHQYLPTGRTRMEYLRRRETIVHRAVRHREYEIVESLIAAGADIQMANNSWQTPLLVARLIVQGRNPDDYGNRGSFLGRLGPGIAPGVLTSVSHSASPSERILSALEKETMRLRRWSLPRLRAIREVKWPWDEYETDDLGLRFVLFYLAVFVIIVGILTFISHIVSAVPYALYKFGVELDEGLKPLVDLRACYLNNTQNGSSVSPHEACRLKRWELAPLDVPMIIPAVDHRLETVLDVIDDCYDASNNTTLGKLGKESDSEDDEEGFLPGCPDTDTLFKDDRVKDAGLALDIAVYRFLTKECKCKCGWFREPRTGFDKHARLS